MNAPDDHPLLAEATAHLARLIAFDTVSHRSNLELIEHVAAHFSALGADLTRLPDATGNPRFQFRHDAEIGAQETTSKLRDQFLACAVASVLVIVRQIPPHAMLRRRPVDMFMRQNGHVGRSIPETLEGRHLNVIAGGRIEGAVAAMANTSASVCEKPVRMINPLDRIDHLVRPVIIVIRKPVDLVTVEDSVGFQERNIPFHLPAIATGFCLGEPTSIDDGRTGFALADLRADLARLPVGHPEWRFKSTGETF